jgi:hypothetical protein
VRGRGSSRLTVASTYFRARTTDKQQSKKQTKTIDDFVFQNLKWSGNGPTLFRHYHKKITHEKWKVQAFAMK